MSYALIAEPDVAQAEIYRHIVVGEGFEAKVVRDGDQARVALESLGAPALLITELSLARFDGFQLLAQLRRMCSAATSPAVVVSAFRALRDAASRMKEELGIAALLAKTSPVETIRRTVKRVLLASAAPHLPAAALDEEPPGFLSNLAVDDERAEERRLRRLDESGLVDNLPPDEQLQGIVADTAARFGVPVALISLVLEDKQWFKAHVGLEGHLLANRGSPRDWAFCSHVVQGRAPLVVPDAAMHPAFAGNRLVQEGSVRSYAGAPLETGEGDVLGTLCIIDSRPRAISQEQVDDLVVLARSVAGELSLRAERKRLAEEAALAPAVIVDDEESTPLFNSRAYLSVVLDNIDNGVFLLDQARNVIFANRALAELWGMSREAMVGMHRDALLRLCAAHFSKPEEFLARLRIAPEGAYALRGDFELEKPVRRVVRWVTKPVQLAEGVGHMGCVTDITADIDLLRERDLLARTDPVTGLPNRRGGEDALAREAARAQRGGLRMAVVLFDIDRFKEVNDKQGHAAGDAVLKAVARALEQEIRGSDLAVRWGGDEFLAMLPSTGYEGARSFAERVRAAVERLPEAQVHGALLSAGVAELKEGEDPHLAVARADQGLYEAKNGGRNRVR